MQMERRRFCPQAGLYLQALVVLTICWQVRCHGRLNEPPSRATAWRFGFDTPHNYNDHELFCGGYTRQWNRNGGKCGVCGDPWDAPEPRAHELGGRFGQGVIVRGYKPGTAITIKVQLTASHYGYFEFRVCDDPERTTQECLDKYVLTMARGNGGETKFYPKDGSKEYEMKYRLPEGLSCEHCVLQWRYIAGNNWGDCGNGTGAVGCGPQEEFRACADIAIGDKFTSTTRRPHPSYVPPSRRPLPGKTGSTEESGEGSSWVPLLIAALALLCALGLFAVLYLYYYRGGERIKNILAWRTRTGNASQPPVAPPRQKRHSLVNVPPLGQHKMYAEPGFETVDLRGH